LSRIVYNIRDNERNIKTLLDTICQKPTASDAVICSYSSIRESNTRFLSLVYHSLRPHSFDRDSKEPESSHSGAATAASLTTFCSAGNAVLTGVMLHYEIIKYGKRLP